MCEWLGGQERNCYRSIRRPVATAVWRNGSASDSRSEGWEFESLCGHILKECWRSLRNKIEAAHAVTFALAVNGGVIRRLLVVVIHPARIELATFSVLG